MKINNYICGMSRIMAIDYGTKRCGIAVTDPLKIIASALTTVATDDLLGFVEEYFKKEVVECLVIGEPRKLDGSPSVLMPQIIGFRRKIERIFPKLKIAMQDETFTSRRASEIILQSGRKKKQRQNKALVDQISASLILQDYMEASGL